MIFRSIVRRRMRARFGRFMDEQALDETMSKLSEWDCFILSLPRWAVPIFRRPLTDEELAVSLEEFRKSALSARREQASDGI